MGSDVIKVAASNPAFICVATQEIVYSEIGRKVVFEGSYLTF